MIIKKSSKNQIAIPTSVLKSAGLTAEDIFFEIEYTQGRIVLVPLQFEEKIPLEALVRFRAKSLKKEAGDRVYRSMGEAIRDLEPKSAR